MENLPVTKQCRKCGEILPAAAFALMRSASDGLQGWCRRCNSAWAAAHRPRKLAIAPQVEAGEKWCRRCNTVKPVDAFAISARRPDGRQTYCRSCQAADYRAKQEAQGRVVRPPDIPEGHKFCRTCQTIKPISEFGIRRAARDGLMSACRSCRSDLGRRDHLKRSYDLTEEEVAAMYDVQEGVCAICRTAPAVHVDHDHKSGKVRGMLCFRCNAALGQFGDAPGVLIAGARYLMTSERKRFGVEFFLAERLAAVEFGSAS